MKRIFCLTITLCLVLSSFSFIFAVDWSTTDQQNLSSAASRLLTISNTLNNIYSALNVQGHTIAYWVEAINSWMSPIYLRLQDILQASLDPTISPIAHLLGLSSTDPNTGVTSFSPYLAYNSIGVAQYVSDLKSYLNNNGWGNSVSSQGMYTTNWDGSVSTYNFIPSLNWQQNMALLFQFMNNNITQSFAGLNYKLHNDAWGIAVLNDPLTLQESRTSYISTDHMLELYLQNLGASTARLSYVLASPERIEAQQEAAANEQEVVDSFIDSNGSGAASTSDFSDMAGLSSGYSYNFNTGQSASGLFTVFGSDKWTYLSQETMDSFDTTGNGNRRSKSNTEYDTPYLDRYYEEVLSLMGLEND